MTPGDRLRRLLAAVFACATLAAAPSAALATQSGVGGYSLNGASSAHEVEGSSLSANSSGSGGATQSTGGHGGLPFTGLDVGLVLAAGIGLAGLGLVLRRYAGPPRGRP